MAGRIIKLLLLLALLLPPFGFVAHPQQAKLTPQQEADVLNQADSILRELVTLRQAPPPRPFRKEFKSRDQLREQLLKYSEENKNQQELEAERKTLVAFGLISTDFPYRDFAVKLLTEQIAGFYDYHSHELNLLDSTPVEMQIPTLAHELTHALQDQDINLKNFEEPSLHNDDLTEAHQSLVEGDATAMMFDFLMRRLGRGLKALGFDVRDILKQNHQVPSADMKEFQEAPRAIQTTLTAPYLYGAYFFQYFLRDNDWPQVSALYLDPPRSMEQVMHSEKYFDHCDNPVLVTLPNPTPRFLKHWKEVDTNVLGELGARIVLQQFLNDDNSRLASEGWGGDQYKIYEDSSGHLLLLFFTNWDTEEDAFQFFNAYRVLLGEKYKQLKLENSEDKKFSRWSSGASQIGLEIRGDDVIVMEGVPKADFNGLRDVLWQSKKEMPKPGQVIISRP